METVILLVHLMIAVALVGVVLLQRSEGGALGIGGGGGGLVSGRGAANLLTRATAILAAAFFLTSIGLSLLAGFERRQSILDEIPIDTTGVPAPAPLLPETPQPGQVGQPDGEMPSFPVEDQPLVPYE